MINLLMLSLHIVTLSIPAAAISADQPLANNVSSTTPDISSNSSSAISNIGLVISSIQIKNHTFIEVLQGEQHLWLAVPKTDLTVGVQVRFGNGIKMVDFYMLM